MSFGKLKSARKAREVHSFVKSGSISSPTHTDTPSMQQFSLHSESPIQVDDEGVKIPPSDMAVGKDASMQGSPLAPGPDVASQRIGLPPSQTPAAAQEKAQSVDLRGCHVKLPSSLDIRESSPQGRGLYTKVAQSAGSIILSVVPHVSVLSTANLAHYCSACAGPASTAGLKRCQKCKIVYYCNSDCQNRDWVRHKPECSALQKWATSAPSSEVSIPSEPVRCLGRILWGSQREALDGNWAREIRMMHSNRTSLQPSAFESHTHLAHSVVRYLGVSSPRDLEPYGLTSASDLVDLISRFTTNTFTLTTPALTPIGICVSPTVAFANHSCDPDAVIVFPRVDSVSPAEEPSLHLVALRDISPGNEVQISYVDTTLPKRLRQKELKEVYSFDCRCKLCARALPADPREALWCPKNCGGICSHPIEGDPGGVTRCVKCNATLGDVGAVLDALRVGRQALDKASSLQFDDPAKARQLTANLIPILISAGLTPASHPLLALTRLHQELLVETLLSPGLSQETLDEAIRTATKYSAGLQALLPKGHPVRAVGLAELGKLLAVDEPAPTSAASDVAGRFPPSGPPRLRLAYESFMKAHEEVLIGFGKKDGAGQLGKEIRDSIVRLEKELGVWTTGIRNVLEDTASGAWPR